jgi:hypothetical protein
MINLMQGDCLERMKEIESGSVDLILTDPPYGTMNGFNGITWDIAISPELIFKEANRILRKNGKLILFSQEPYTSKLITEAIPNVPFSQRLTWVKDHFANALLCNKACVSYTEDILVFSKTHDTNYLHPLISYLKDCKVKSRLTNKQFNNIFSDYTNKKGNRDRSVIEHYWGSKQFCIPTEDIYNNVLKPTGFFIKEYSELKLIDDKFKKSLPSVFNLAERLKV